MNDNNTDDDKYSLVAQWLESAVQGRGHQFNLWPGN